MAQMGPKPGTVQKRPPHDTITDGKGAVGVLLSNRPTRVWVDSADFTSIVEKHGNRSWSWVKAKRYVRLKPDARSEVPIARLVVGDSGRFIRFLDSDRLNLRRANLGVEEALKPGGRVKRETPTQRVAPAPKVKERTPLASSLLLATIPHKKVMVPKQTVQATPAVKRSSVR